MDCMRRKINQSLTHSRTPFPLLFPRTQKTKGTIFGGPNVGYLWVSCWVPHRTDLKVLKAKPGRHGTKQAKCALKEHRERLNQYLRCSPYVQTQVKHFKMKLLIVCKLSGAVSLDFSEGRYPKKFNKKLGPARQFQIFAPKMPMLVAKVQSFLFYTKYIHVA